MTLFYNKGNLKKSITTCMLLACTALGAVSAISSPADSSRVRKTILRGRAILPAATFRPGPTSGKLVVLKDTFGQTLPLINKQPVQGFSAVHRVSDSIYMVMPDNGFGTLEMVILRPCKTPYILILLLAITL